MEKIYNKMSRMPMKYIRLITSLAISLLLESFMVFPVFNLFEKLKTSSDIDTFKSNVVIIVTMITISVVVLYLVTFLLLVKLNSAKNLSRIVFNFLGIIGTTSAFMQLFLSESIGVHSFYTALLILFLLFYYLTEIIIDSSFILYTYVLKKSWRYRTQSKYNYFSC